MFVKYSVFDKTLKAKLIQNLVDKYKGLQPIIICLGNGKIVGDSVGVLAADILRKRNLDAFVLGGSKNPINNKKAMFLQKKLNKYPLLFIDSAISNENNTIYFNSRGIRLWNGKTLSGSCIVASTIKYERSKIILSSCNYNNVLKYSEIISDSIVSYLKIAKIINIVGKNINLFEFKK